MDGSCAGSRRFTGAEILVPTECKNCKALREPPPLPLTEETNGGPEMVFQITKQESDRSGPGIQVFYPVICGLSAFF